MSSLETKGAIQEEQCAFCAPGYCRLEPGSPAALMQQLFRSQPLWWMFHPPVESTRTTSAGLRSCARRTDTLPGKSLDTPSPVLSQLSTRQVNTGDYYKAYVVIQGRKARLKNAKTASNEMLSFGRNETSNVFDLFYTLIVSYTIPCVFIRSSGAFREKLQCQ